MTSEEIEMKTPEHNNEVVVTTVRVNGVMIGDVSVYKGSDGQFHVTVTTFIGNENFHNIKNTSAKIFGEHKPTRKALKNDNGKIFHVITVE